MDRKQQEQLKEYLHLAKALLDSMNENVRSDDAGNIWKYAGYKTYIRKYNCSEPKKLDTKWRCLILASAGLRVSTTVPQIRWG